MKTLPVLSALLIIVVVVSLVPGLARGSATAAPLPPPQPSDPIESRPSALAQVAAPDSMPGRVPIVLYASKGVAPFHVAPRVFPSLYQIQSTTFVINYIPAGTKNKLGDDCLSWPAGSQAAFQYAANLWGVLLNSSVPIKIDACWASLDEGVLGHSATDIFYRNFSGAPQTNTWYSVALANALSGTDRNGNTAEMHIAYSDNGISWYFGADRNPSMGEYDFVSVVLHEIAHGLNFAGSMWVDIPGYIGCGSVGWGCWGLESSPPYYPVIYDRFAEDGNAVSLLNIGAYPNPSTALGNVLRGQVSGVYFNGTNAKAANGNSRVKLYTPSTWQGGSSYAHLDEMFNGTTNALMTYSLDDGEAVHDPGPVTCGIFLDLGWQNACQTAPAPPAAPSTLVVTATLQTQINLTWADNSDNETGFKIERSPDGTSGWTAIYTTTASVTSYSNTGLTCGTPYYYRVRAYNADGHSSYSNTASDSTSACPSAPNVGIVKRVLGSNFKAGDYITFTLTLSNSGNLMATNVVVSDVVPLQVLDPTCASSLSITPTGVYSYVWNVGTLGMGQSGVITIYGQIDPELGNGFSFNNTATIAAPQDATPDNNASTVTVGSQRKVYLPVTLRNYCAPFTISDPSFMPNQYDMRQINADDAWLQCVQGAGVVVAVIDTGVSQSHPDLVSNLIAGYDYVDSDATPEDGNGHGSNVAGIVGAALNGVGVVGVAPGARLLPVRVLDDDGLGYTSWVASGILFAADRAQVLNLSLGSTNNSTTMLNAINYAANTKGRLVIVSAGNCGDAYYSNNGCSYMNQPVFPGAYSNVMAVAAVNSSDVKASFSNQGSYVDIAAPGVQIYNTYKNGGYVAVSGTSQAAPHVAGLAALIWAKNPSYTAAQVRSAMETTAVDLGTAGWDYQYGWGRIDAGAALGLTRVATVKTEAAAPRTEWTAPVDQRDVEIAPGRILIKFQSGVSAASVQQKLSAFSGVSIAGQVTALDVHVLSVPQGQEWALIDQLRVLPDVAYAEPDYAIKLIR